MHVPNRLQLIRDRLVKAQRLHEAQMLSLTPKYRGIPYVKSQQQKRASGVLTYRGSSYVKS